jgi:hypothetical protein
MTGIWLAGPGAGLGSALESMPFYPGEKLTYSLKWGIVHAGEATLEVLPMKDVEGEWAYHFVMTAKTSSFIDAFYKVRDRVEAYADLGMNRSLMYKKLQKEGRHKRDILVQFDWARKTAQYSNFGNSAPPISLTEGTLDPLAAFYYTRLFDFKEGMVLERPVTDGKKHVVAQCRVVRREAQTVGNRTYDTFLVEPDLRHVGGVFQKSDHAKLQIWITADHRRIPVRVESEVAVGRFVGEIVTPIEDDPAGGQPRYLSGNP